MSNMEVEVLYPSSCELGEGPFYYQGRCFWFDIVNAQLQACDMDGQQQQTYRLAEMFSAAAQCVNGDLLLASESALWRYDHTRPFDAINHPLEKLQDLEADKPQNRSNDGRADRHGGFWIGTMGKNAQAQAGAIYRYFRGELVELQDKISITNAICFAPDGRYAYFTDSSTGIIRRWALDSGGWPKGEAQDWAEMPQENTAPDGAVVDSAGFLWNAQWGSGQVVRYTPTGRIDQQIQLPTEHISCPAFAGPALRHLFITSARQGLSPGQLTQQPLAGAVFSIPLTTPGMAEGKVELP